MRRQLSDALLLRTAKSDQDAPRLIDFNARVHSDRADPDPRIGEAARAMLSAGQHPTMRREDFVLVEDTATGQIVSSMCLIPQAWTYAGVPFGVGRPELVGTHPDYRRQGLVRAQFEAIHERCAALDLPVQAITGIPYFYRQFGYEYALSLGGGRRVPMSAIASTPDSEFSLRPASLDDIPSLDTLYNSFARRALIACPRGPAHWRYRLGLSDTNIDKQWIHLIVHRDQIIGYVDILKETRGSQARVTELVLSGLMPDLAAWLLPRLRDEISQLHADAAPPIDTLYLNLGARHPIYPFLARWLPTKQPPYAWYIRVSDLAEFAKRIAPELERRVAASPLAGLTRGLALDFYQSGLRLTFEGGKLINAVNAAPTAPADASFPPLTFLQALFGYRSVSGLATVFPDVRLSTEAAPILETLFPRRWSWVKPLT